MARENCGGEVVKTWEGYFLRDDLKIRKSSDIEPHQAYSLFREKPYGRVKVFAGSLEWAITESEKAIAEDQEIERRDF